MIEDEVGEREERSNVRIEDILLVRSSRGVGIPGTYTV